MYMNLALPSQASVLAGLDFLYTKIIENVNFLYLIHLKGCHLLKQMHQDLCKLPQFLLPLTESNPSCILGKAMPDSSLVLSVHDAFCIPPFIAHLTNIADYF